MLVPLRACAMDLERNRILRVGKYSGLILSPLYTEVHDILGKYRGPLVLSNVLALLYVMFRSEGIRH